MDDSIKTLLDPALPIIIEAEDPTLDLVGYIREDRFKDDRGIVDISLITKHDPPLANGERFTYADQGRVFGLFQGPAGRYNIEIDYYDEVDGTSQLSFFLDGQKQDEWKLDENPPSMDPNDPWKNNTPNADNLRTRTVATGVDLDASSTFSVDAIRAIAGDSKGEEGARIDRFRFIPVAPDTPDVTGMAMEDGPVVGLDINGRNEFTYTLTSQPINILGQQEGSARIGQIDVPVPAATTIIQAEDLTLDGYIPETERFKEDGIAGISLIRKTGRTKPNGRMEFEYIESGTAKGDFSGEAGLYDIEVGYYDEEDGISQLSFSIDGEKETVQDTWLLDEKLGGSKPLPSNFKTRIVASDIALSAGNSFEIEGIQNAGGQERQEEGARVDFIRFIPKFTTTVSVPGLLFDPEDDFQDLGVGETRDVTFDYKVTDGNGLMSEPATAVVTVKGVNDAPVALDDSATTDENTPTAPIVVLANDSDIDNTDIVSTPPAIVDVLTVAQIEGQDVAVGDSVVLASGAIATLNADYTITYDPNGQFDNLFSDGQGADRFNYTVSDGRGGIDEAVVDIIIEGVGVKANDDSIRIQEGAPTPGSENSISENVLTNDKPVDLGLTVTSLTVNGSPVQIGTSVTVTDRANPNDIFGQLTVNADGTYTFDLNDLNPRVNALNVGDVLSIPADIQYTASLDGETDTATLSITIDGTNDAPVAQSDVLSGIYREGNPLKFDANRLLFNDSDVDSANLRIMSVDSQSKQGGTITFDGTDIIYTHPDFFITHDINGIRNSQVRDTFTYSIVDDQGKTSVGTVELPEIQDSEVRFIERDEAIAGNFNNVFSENDYLRIKEDLPANQVRKQNFRSGKAQTIARNHTFQSENYFAVSPNSNTAEDNLRAQVSGKLGRAQFAPEVDIYRVFFNAGERITLDVDDTNAGQLDTKVLVFDPGLVDDLLNPGIMQKPGVAHRNRDADSVDFGSNSLKDPFLEFTATESGFYHVAVATEDTAWKTTAGSMGTGDNRVRWTAGQFVKTGNNSFAGDYTLHISIDNPMAIEI